MPTNYPLLFTFHDRVSGNGFLADVATHGRALAVQEDDGWWMSGVQPGAIAGGGRTLLEAHADFRRTFTAVLFDIAAEAENFQLFNLNVRAFFDQTNDESIAEWDAAVLAVRRREITARDLPVTPNGIREERADSPRFIAIERKEKFQPTDNALDPSLAVAA